MHTTVWNYLAFFVGATALAWVVMKYLSDRSQQEREQYERAVPGVARVLKIASTTPSRSYGTILMDLLIQVHRNGVEPYELSMIWSVEPGAVNKMRAGETFAIKVDPLDRTRVYSGETWAHSLGVMKKSIE
jgi:hypothetical protein